MIDVAINSKIFRILSFLSFTRRGMALQRRNGRGTTHGDDRLGKHTLSNGARRVCEVFYVTFSKKTIFIGLRQTLAAAISLIL